MKRDYAGLFPFFSEEIIAFPDGIATDTG